MRNPLRIVLLCAGEIGYRCLRRILQADVAKLLAIFSYQVEPPQQAYLAWTLDLARQYDVPVYVAANVGKADYREVWETLKPDYILAIKWRTMVPQWVIDLSQHGLLVFHAALLPQYRGFAPVNWVLINGEEKTGVTMFYAAEEVDAGDIIDQREIPLTDADNAATLDAKVTALVEQMLVENLPRLAAGTAPRMPQDHSQATYTIWRCPEDGLIDWNQPTRTIFNLIRGLTYPYPGAFTFLHGCKLIIWSAEMEPAPRCYVGNIPGKVERFMPGAGVNVLTQDGILRLKDVQLDGDVRRPATEVLKKLKTQLG